MQDSIALPNWQNHVISVRQFSRQDLDEVIFPEAESMLTLVKKVGKVSYLNGKVLSILFYEPSTRTAASFITAIERLGGSTIPIQEVTYSSVSKGESLRDTVRTLARYSDAIVLRHKVNGAAAEAASVSRVPIINAGDGTGEHPTQALLDLFTIRKSLGSTDGLTVTMVGDLLYGRTVHSLSRLLALYKGTKINLVSPDILRMPPEMVSELKKQGISLVETDSLESVLPETNVLYMTRVQKERFANPFKYDLVKDCFVLTPELMKKAKRAGEMIVMHPLPRVGEIVEEVDNDPRAVYFDQVEYGMFVRMALLSLMLRRN